MPRTILAAAGAALLLAGCGTDANDDARLAPGANPGIVEESQVGTGAGEPPLGALQGGLLAADIGRSLNETERQAALRAEYEALEYARAGRPVIWRSGGTYGDVSVGAEYTVNRLECREFTHRVYIGGRARISTGTACRQPDGVWRVIE
jgi:surface antigen